MARAIEGDRTYVMDRGRAKFHLFNRIVDTGSSNVCGIRDNSVYEVVEERVLTDADRNAQVLSDQQISPDSSNAQRQPEDSGASCCYLSETAQVERSPEGSFDGPEL